MPRFTALHAAKDTAVLPHVVGISVYSGIATYDSVVRYDMDSTCALSVHHNSRGKRVCGVLSFSNRYYNMPHYMELMNVLPQYDLTDIVASLGSCDVPCCGAP